MKAGTKSLRKNEHKCLTIPSEALKSPIQELRSNSFE